MNLLQLITYVPLNFANGVASMVGDALQQLANTLIATTTKGWTIAPVAVTNKATGGVIGTAAATVDINKLATINQTTASQTCTLPAPTDATQYKEFTVINIGSAAVTMYGRVLTATAGTGPRGTFFWTGAAWV